MIDVRQLRIRSLAALAAACGVAAVAGLCSMMASAAPDATPAPAHGPHAAAPAVRAPLDRSGRRQVGKASFYAKRYSGKTMADGTPMRLYSNNAASLTLPLGTTAQVTNLETGLSAVVTIRDRGPYVKGRIIDLSPATAQKIGIDRKKGLAKVEVAPIAVPLPDGSIKLASIAAAGDVR